MRVPRLIAMTCLVAAPALAADTPPATLTPGADASIGKACSAPVFRQFDFWLGRWTVTNPAGKVIGHSRIARISRGCAIHERWLGRVSTGHSLSYYDHATRQWHQDWVGGNGRVLHLRGGRQGDAMVLEGKHRGTRGEVLDRITWAPLDHHRVRQRWEASRDGGSTWKILFTGIYAPRPEPGAA